MLAWGNLISGTDPQRTLRNRRLSLLAQGESSYGSFGAVIDNAPEVKADLICRGILPRKI